VARILRRNVFTILNATLFTVALLLIPLGRYLDAAFTAVPVATNVVMAVFLEIRAKMQLERLRLVHRPRVTVVRDGTEHEIPVHDVVLGDVLLMARGDQAVVDGRVVAGLLEMDESVLTGESVAVVRRPGDEVLALPVLASFWLAGEGLLADETVRAAAVLVALVPQGLAIMATVTYSVAAVRVSRAGAIIQRIDAAESMSRIDLLCLDKTGTITSSQLELADVVAAEGVNAGELRRRIGRLAASSRHVDRTVTALRDGLPSDPAPIAREVAFSSARRWSAIVFHGEASATALAAPDALDGARLGGLAAVGRSMAEQGCRVLAVLDVSARALDGSHQGPPADGPVLGLIALREQLRPDAHETLGDLRERGVRMKLVSGDDPRTVSAIASAAGIGVLRTMVGEQLDQGEGTLGDRVAEVDVFGRVRPEDKPRIVEAMRERGHYVGMVGDGVNDVLALRRAHIGIAMESGSPAARAVAGMVLLKDRFAILPQAITEGQRVVSSMIAVACVLLARTVYMLILVAAAVLAGLPFPFTPTTNAVLAMVTVGLPIFLLAMWVPPVKAPPSVVKRTLRYAIPAGIAVALLVVPVMLWAFETADVATARSIVTTSTVFAGIALIPVLFPVARDRNSPVGPGGDLRPALMAAAMLVLYGIVMAVPLARDIYDLVPLPADLILVLGLATAIWALSLILLIRTGVPRRILAPIFD
jgi:cation-transporting P-type ATPase E